MIQIIKADGTTSGPGLIQIIDKYGNPKTPFVPIVWGTITGTLSAQTDLQDALNLKEDKINKGLPNGYASLNGAGLVPSSQLPSYVDDVVEVANYAALPIPGETGKIYVTLDTNEVYRWSGSAYIEIAANPAVWGTITGTVTAQTDLTSYISSNYYPLVTNPAGYITSAALAPYLTSATAASTYYPLTNPNGYISGITSGMVTTALGFTPYDAANPAGYITSSALTPYLLSSTAASTYYPLTNPSGYITASALTPYLTTASAALTYYPIPTGTTSQYIRGDGSVASFPTIPSVTPSALTKTDDTNVTLTLGGSPSTALLAATSITVGWTGTLADSRIASASTWNAKQDALSGTGFVKSTAGVISYDTNTYLTTADAASTYYPLTNPAGYITASSLTGYVPYTGATADLNLGTCKLVTPLVDSTGGLTLNATGNIGLKSYNSSIATFATNSFSFFPVSVSSGFSTTFTFTKPNNTNQTASTNMPGWNYQGGSRQWLAGTIANQTENVWGAVTYSFTSASTITNATGNVFNAPIAGTNATFTNSLAALFNGNIQVPSGTVSNNSIQIGAPNVGLFSPSANRIDFVTNGIARMAIISNGNVVMGNTTTSVIGNSYLDYVTNQTGLKLSATALNLAVTGSNLLNIFGVTTSSNTTSFSLTKPNNTGQTATFSISGWTYNGGSRQWNTGNIGTQNENVWGAVTYDFVGASIVSKAIGNVFNAPIAGTNATITDNFAAQFNGRIELLSSMSFNNGTDSMRISRASGALGRLAFSRPGNEAVESVTFGGGNEEIYIRSGAGKITHSGPEFQINNSTGSTGLGLYATAGDLNLYGNSSTNAVRVFGGTRNVTIQNGGTFTDNGYKLEVVGTSNFTDRVSVGNYATPSAQRIFTIGQDTAFATFGSCTDYTPAFGIWFGQTTFTTSNAAINAGSNYTNIQSPAKLQLRAYGVYPITCNDANLTFLTNSLSYGAFTSFTFTKPNNTGQTASTSIAGWNYNGGSRTWLVGNITAQNENIWGAVTYNFGGASVIAKAIGNVFNAPIAGTNTTITANFAAQFNGNVEMVGAMTALYYMSVSNPNAVATASAKFQVTNAAGNTSQFSIASNSDAVDPSLLSIGGSNKGVEFSSNSVRALKILDGSRNVTIQNGGTVTDNGYRLEVFGTTNVVGTTSTDAVTLSAEQLTTGTGANWTGTSYTTGYTHTVGSVVPLVSALIPSANTYYQIVFTLSGRTAGSVNIAFSLYSLNGLNNNGTTTIGIRSLSTVTPAFTLTPTTDFDGTIVASIKFISAIMAPLATYKTSTSVVNTEIRSGVTTQNTYIGANVGRYNTTGLQNVGLGFNAMPNNMTGVSNTVIGYVAGVSNVNGSNNTYVGSGAGYFSVSGASNTCIGASAGFSLTGSSNIFIGVSTGNGSGGTNTGIGNLALAGLTTGGSSNGVGYAALQLLTTASYNDALGREAGANNTTGNGNQFFGFRAGRYIADGTTSNAITENSIYIGYQTKALANNQINQIVIGYNSTGIGSNTTVLGNSSTVTTAIYGNLMLGTTTASTYKLDVQGTANILTSLNLGNYATPTAQRIFTIGQDTSYTTIGSLVGATSNAAMYMNTATPSVSNYTFRSDGANVWVNSPSTSASIILTTGSTATPLRMYGNQNTASTPSYVLVKPTYVNGIASTAIPGWSYDGTTRQWLTGNITTQNENVWGATTYSFVGASTITTAIGNVFNAPIAGTNCTITNNLAALFNGNVQIGSTGQLFEFKQTASNPTYTQTGATGSSIYTVSGGLQVRMQSFSGGQNWLFATGGRFLTGTSDAQPFEFYTTNLKRVQISANGSMVFYIGTTYDEGANIAIGTTTGTRIGTATNQKIGFWFATPVVQPANTTSLNGVLENTGLMASGSTISTINKPLVVGTNTTPRTGVATDGVTSVLGDLQNFTTNYHSGEVLYSEVSGEALSFGQLCWRDRFGKWSLALGNVAGESAYNMLGICLHTVGAADTAISILTRGYVETTYISATNTGSPLYMSAATAGSITDTFPAAAGNVVRLVGNVFWDAASQTNGKWVLYFNPDSTWIEL